MFEIIWKYGDTSEENVTLDKRMIIAEDLDRIFTRTFIFELNTQSLRLCGKTEEEKYKSFIRMLESDDYQKELQKAYPVLGEMLTTRDQIVNSFLNDVRMHFDIDYQELIHHKMIKERDVQIQKIQCTSGDTHNGAKRVMLLTLSDGSKILYKPHSLAVDKAFHDIIVWFSRYLNIEFKSADVLDKGSYGWCSYITSAPCMDRDQVCRYFYRYGVLIFVTKILGSTDMHYENLIASGEFPVIIDSEMLLGHGQTILDSALDEISTIFRESVLHSGLLPIYIFNSSGEGVDVSAISGENGVEIPLEVPTVVNAGRSDMHIEYQHPQTAGGNNRCKLRDEFQKPYRFLKEIKQGFIDSYHVAMEHREALILLIHSFSRMPVRVLLQNTQTYSSILNISWHPRFLTKKGQREEMFEILKDKKDPESLFSKWRLQEEKKSLILSDIPYFFCFPGEQRLMSGSGAEYPGFFRETIIQAIERRIRNLCKADLKVQLNLIEAALCMGRRDLLPKANIYFEREGIRAKDRIEAAEKLADMIVHQIIRSENGEVGWIQFSLGGYQEKDQMIYPVGMYLYNGLAGMLLFFSFLIQQRSYMGYICNPIYEEVCAHLTKQVLSYTDRITDVENANYAPTGLLNGEGSLALLYQLLYLRDKNDQWLTAMKKQCTFLSRKIEFDHEYDFLSGNAGAVMVLLNAYELTDDRSYLHTAIKAGEYLLSHAQKDKNGWCWRGSAVKKGLTGMAHGNAGIIMAFHRLVKYSKKEEFYLAAEEAMRYEDSFYDTEKNDWMDLRLPSEKVWANEGTRAWCHGYGGLILSRLKVAEKTDKPLLISQEVIKRYMNKYNNKVRHTSLCLCHGKTGDYALQLLTGRNHAAQKELSEIIGFILDEESALEDRLSVQERWNYGLMSGLSGIGFALLAGRAELDALFTGYLR